MCDVHVVIVLVILSLSLQLSFSSLVVLCVWEISLELNCLLAFSVILVMFMNIFIFPCFFRYNLQSDVRAAMYEEAEKWMRAVGRRKFMGGSAPNLADLVLLYY